MRPSSFRPSAPCPPQRIAVIGSGISGLSAAWLLGMHHQVTLFEAENRLGGHSCTVEAPGPKGPLPVDMGFIVYNEAAYPNLTALFAHLGVQTRETCMSLGISLDDGDLEYGSRGLAGLLAQPTNLFSPRFISMLRELVRFYREGPRDMARRSLAGLSLGDYLNSRGYSEPFQTDHLLPQAAAIWSAPLARMRDYPAEAFIRFFENHGLLKLVARPEWRTVTGGSRTYVAKLRAAFRGEVREGAAVARVSRGGQSAVVHLADGSAHVFDQVVLATHSDQALKLLDAPSSEEAEILGAIPYAANLAVLHRDIRLMPRRRAAWSSWNYVGHRRAADGESPASVSYWMNRLQGIPGAPLIVSLNPATEPDPEKVLAVRTFDHPVFDRRALEAQARLWSLQGVRRTWFCGAWFGAGFHEDGLQAGLATAEAIGGVRRPWRVAAESGRIVLPAAPLDRAA